MKRTIKQNLKQMLPVVIVIGITLLMSLVLYRKVMNREEQQCWQILEDSAKYVTTDIQTKFKDDISVLRTTADLMKREERLSAEKAAAIDRTGIRENTVFARIDFYYPDHTVLLEDGTQKEMPDDLDFSELFAQGEQMSARRTDEETGEESVFYYLPVEQDEDEKLILVGVMNQESLGNLVHTNLYDGNAAYCIVDSEDGAYILDSWHPELGNAFATPDRKKLKQYENVDLKDEIRNQRTGVIAFESKTNGRDIYMYYTPVSMFEWELLIFTQEDVIFANLLYLKQLLIYAGVIELMLLLLYFLWNLRSVQQLSKSKAETVEQLEISNTLLQCVTELSTDRDWNISIEKLLEIINHYFQADRTHIFELNEAGDIFLSTYEYVRDGAVPLKDAIPEIPFYSLNRGLRSFEKNSVYYIRNVELDGEPEYDELLKRCGITHLLAVPLESGGKVTGFVSVDNPEKSFEDATLLSSIQFFISNSLAQKRQQDALEFMSYRDKLTGLYNRNKYICVLDAWEGRELQNLGAAYLDLNGLKEVNDQKGHEAGDALIRGAAEVVAENFPHQSYRVGGDEFVIVAPEMERTLFEEKIRRIREKMQERQISTSIGALWEKSCENLEELLKKADAQMYEEKQNYYHRKHETERREKQ